MAGHGPRFPGNDRGILAAVAVCYAVGRSTWKCVARLWPTEPCDGSVGPSRYHGTTLEAFGQEVV